MPFLPINARLLRLLGGAALALTVLSGCASTRSSPAPRSPAPSSPDTELTASRVEQQLRTAVRRWRGTSYQFGGTTMRGIDCSGLIYVLYADLFDVELPRTTREQVRVGQRIPADALQPGDLVFFWLPDKQRHAGIYLRDGTFAHASVSQGVTISTLEEDYWNRSYWMARRLLPNLSTRPSLTAFPSGASPRTGW